MSTEFAALKVRMRKGYPLRQKPDVKSALVVYVPKFLEFHGRSREKRVLWISDYLYDGLLTDIQLDSANNIWVKLTGRVGEGWFPLAVCKPGKDYATLRDKFPQLPTAENWPELPKAFEYKSP